MFPTARGPNTGALCLECLIKAFRGLKENAS